jgi:hypothetical protein
MGAAFQEDAPSRRQLRDGRRPKFNENDRPSEPLGSDERGEEIDEDACGNQNRNYSHRGFPFR